MLRFNPSHEGKGKYHNTSDSSLIKEEIEIVLPQEFALHKIKLNLVVDIHFNGTASCRHEGVMYKEEENHKIFQIFDEKGNPESWYAIEKNNS